MRKAITIGAGLFLAAQSASALDEAHYRKAREMIDRSIGYLRSVQHGASGGWVVSEDRPTFPGITALVINGMLMEPDIDARDESVARGLAFLLSKVQDDGGIYDAILPSYNTALSLSALARANTPEAAAAIPPAQQFLISLQWDERSESPESTPERPRAVDRDHPFYGGIGYGGSSRPDNSNLNLALQGLRDSGLSCDHEAFQKAMVFLSRTQMLDEANDMPYADGSSQGGFIYATSPNGDNIGAGETKAQPEFIEETMDDGTKVSRFRAYGSMTYAGFKTMIYANLDRDDYRVQAAYDWLRRNYTLEENPGCGTEGLYYYFLTMSRALDAWGLPTITLINEDGSTKEEREWANDLIDRLASLQNDDGSFRSVDDRWMESNPVLITAYSLLALQHAIN